MDATRRARLQSVILEEISTLISRELKDPRIPVLTLTKVDVTDDGQQATIFFSILETPQTEPLNEAEEKARALRLRNCLEGLKAASGFLRRHLAKALSVRHIPVLIFKEDVGLANSIRVHELLKQLEKEKVENSQ